MQVGDLFSGIGGFAYAAQQYGWQHAWFSEIDPAASSILASHWPTTPNLGNIQTIDFTKVPQVDIIVGGFPCQDISEAGKRAGIDGDRSGLWFDYARAIRDLRPSYVVVENVSALARRGLDRVLGSLASLGYDAEWQCYRAADIGAPHKRDRLWLLAYPQRSGLEGHTRANESAPRWSFEVGPTSSKGVPHRADFERWWSPQPSMGGVVDGIPSLVDRAAWERGIPRVVPTVNNYRQQLTALGNAIVPQCAIPCFNRILELEAS